MYLLRQASLLTRFLKITAAFALCVCTSESESTAQDYPTKPVQIVSSFSIGSATDLLARQVADKLSSHLGGPVIVVNKPGAGGIIAADFVAKSVPDGYTLLFGNSAMALWPSLYKKLPFDVSNDFVGVGLVAESPYIVVVNNDVGVKNMQELLALAKAKPKSLNFASGGVGSGTHLACELLAIRAGVELTHVPYSNFAQIPIDLQNNAVQMMCSPLASILPLLGKGRVSVIGVSSEAPMTEPIQVPSIKQSTSADFVAYQWFGLFALRNTPDATIRKLAKALAAAVEDQGFSQRLKVQALQRNPLYLSAFDDYFAKELKMWRPIVQSTGIKLEN